MSDHLVFVMWLIATDGFGNKIAASEHGKVEIYGGSDTVLANAVKLFEMLYDVNFDEPPEIDVVMEDELGPRRFSFTHYEIFPLEKGQRIEFRRVD